MEARQNPNAVAMLPHLEVIDAAARGMARRYSIVRTAGLTGDDCVQLGVLHCLRYGLVWYDGTVPEEAYWRSMACRGVSEGYRKCLHRQRAGLPGVNYLPLACDEHAHADSCLPILEDDMGPGTDLCGLHLDLGRALATLPGNLYQLVCWRYGLGGSPPLTTRALAARLGVDARTIRRWLVRAHELLAARLGGYDPCGG